ncbi:MAG: hypothetical protein RMM98_12090 [Acidobacteriota bacterium]|nr:hypothetical protein [Blastocatellia bacterium]MDW8240350.1 hypothetical protein [Acidobacteriota bacterium]
MGKFSTYKRFTLTDETSKYETGKTMPGIKFLEEVERDYIEPTAQALLKDPALHLMASESCTDEQYFKVLGQFWAFERAVGALHANWLLGYTLGPNGEYQEVEYMEVRQIWEEFKHARLYEDAILRLGYLDSRWELHSHPWCQLIPEGMALLNFLQGMSRYPIPVRAAANHLASEAPFVSWFAKAGEVVRNRIVADSFGAQVLEETCHANIGRYVVMKYADTSEIQAMTRWACQMVLKYTQQFGMALYDYLQKQEADQLQIVERWHRRRSRKR